MNVRNGVRRTMAGGLAVALCCFAGLSSAQVKESTARGGYGYQFDDDPLTAGGFSSSEATIRIRPMAAKSTLIRPRVTFIPDLLKAVDNL